LGCETTFWQSVWLLAGEPAFRNIGLIIVAVIGIGFAIYRSVKLHQQTKTAIRQAETSEAGLNIDRFQKGAAMLADREVAVRQAGIFILSALMQQRPKEFLEEVRRVLCSFINYSSIEYMNSFKEKPENPDTREDCLTAFHTLCLLNSLRDLAPGTKNVDCRNIYLFFCKLDDRDLSSMRVFDSVLRRCTFNGSIFTNAILADTDFSQCIFRDADLRNSNFGFVNFEYANFENADCNGTIFKNCTNLTYAQLSKAKNVDPKFLAKLKADEDQAAAESAKAIEEDSPT
jgi:hypothetical protein